MIGRLRSFVAVVKAYYAGRLAEHTREMFETPCPDEVEPLPDCPESWGCAVCAADAAGSSS